MQQHPRSKMLFYPYVAMLGFGFASAMYGMGRMVWVSNRWNRLGGNEVLTE